MKNKNTRCTSPRLSVFNIAIHAHRDQQEHLKYILGRRFGLDYAKSTCQVPDRPVDLIGAQYDDIGVNMSISDVHSFVAWEAIVQGHESTRGISFETFIQDPRVEPHAHKPFKAEAIIHEKYCETSIDVETVDLNDPSARPHSRSGGKSRRSIPLFSHR
jgi:hypothetical protein